MTGEGNTSSRQTASLQNPTLPFFVFPSALQHVLSIVCVKLCFPARGRTGLYCGGLTSQRKRLAATAIP